LTLGDNDDDDHHHTHTRTQADAWYMYNFYDGPTPADDADDTAAPKVIDASWFLPDTPFAPPHGVDSIRGHYDSIRIPGAAFWDADADSNEDFSIAPHNLPRLGVFGARMASIGVTPTRPVVVYDQHGMFSAPRLWCVARCITCFSGQCLALCCIAFVLPNMQKMHAQPAHAHHNSTHDSTALAPRTHLATSNHSQPCLASYRYTMLAFGHKDVRVLDGGLPAWLEAGLPVETSDPDVASARDWETMTPEEREARMLLLQPSDEADDLATQAGWVFDSSVQWGKQQVLSNLSGGGDKGESPPLAVLHRNRKSKSAHLKTNAAARVPSV
jgi:hypothetical protein